MTLSAMKGILAAVGARLGRRARTVKGKLHRGGDGREALGFIVSGKHEKIDNRNS